MKPNFLTDKRVIITAAIRGVIHGKWANPCLPLTVNAGSFEFRTPYGGSIFKFLLNIMISSLIM